MKNPEIEKLLANPMSGPDIEARSFAIIDSLVDQHSLAPREWKVAQRLIHTTADFSLINDLVFVNDPIESGISAVRRGAPVFCDSNMIKSGVSVANLARVDENYSRESIRCFVADNDVTRLAKENGLPRSLYSTRKAQPFLDGAVALFGNAPVALLELNRMVIEDGLKPALVIAMPVGFVHVEESKDELAELGVPAILISGRRGGSPLAVAALNAIVRMAIEESQ